MQDLNYNLCVCVCVCVCGFESYVPRKIKLPSMLQGHVIVANWSRQERGSVSQTRLRESAGTPSQ